MRFDLKPIYNEVSKLTTVTSELLGQRLFHYLTQINESRQWQYQTSLTIHTMLHESLAISRDLALLPNEYAVGMQPFLTVSLAVQTHYKTVSYNRVYHRC